MPNISTLPYWSTMHIFGDLQYPQSKFSNIFPTNISQLSLKKNLKLFPGLSHRQANSYGVTERQTDGLYGRTDRRRQRQYPSGLNAEHVVEFFSHGKQIPLNSPLPLLLRYQAICSNYTACGCCPYFIGMTCHGRNWQIFWMYILTWMQGSIWPF